MAVLWDAAPCSLVDVDTDVSEVLIPAIRAIKPASSAEYLPDYTRRRQNLKYHRDDGYADTIRLSRLTC
jgi:hypothetical protein